MKGWYGFDLDGTLAHYTGWVHETHIGQPIPAMMVVLQQHLAAGHDCRIFTARVCREGPQLEVIQFAIQAWCREHVGVVLPITNIKDYGMIRLYDDRCVAVEPNSGQLKHWGEL